MRLFKKAVQQITQRTAIDSGGYHSLFPALTINAQPVENRRKKSARQGKGLPPQHERQKAGCRRQKSEASPQDAFRQMPSSKGTKKIKGWKILESRC